MDTFYQRLKIALAHARRHPRDVADAMEVTEAALHGLRRTNGQARADNAMRAADFLRVHPRWLILGEGQMLETKDKAWPFDDVTPAQWRAIPAELRSALEALVRAYVDDSESKTPLTR
jgi:hypothetical protein